MISPLICADQRGFHPNYMEEMWLVIAEIVAPTGDRGSRSEIGFMNITTWAVSKDAAASKIQKYLESLGWRLVGVDKAEVVNEGIECNDEIAEMIERTRNNPNAIILGTFHTYKTN